MIAPFITTILLGMYAALDAVSNAEFVLQKLGFSEDVAGFLGSTRGIQGLFWTSLVGLLISIMYQLKKYENSNISIEVPTVEQNPNAFETPEYDLTPVEKVSEVKEESEPITDVQQLPEEPTFTEGFDAVEITLGTNRAIYNVAQLEKAKHQFPIGIVSAFLYVKDGKPYVDVDIHNVPFKPSVRLQQNKIMNRPVNWDMNSDSTALEIVDEKKKPVFQLYYKTPSHIVINGFFIYDKHKVLVSEKMMTLNPTSIKPYPLKPMFRYPSSSHRGERA